MMLFDLEVVVPGSTRLFPGRLYVCRSLRCSGLAIASVRPYCSGIQGGAPHSRLAMKPAPKRIRGRMQCEDCEEVVESHEPVKCLETPQCGGHRRRFMKLVGPRVSVVD